MFHDILHDQGHEQVQDDIVSWIVARMSPVAHLPETVTPHLCNDGIVHTGSFCCVDVQGLLTSMCMVWLRHQTIKLLSKLVS